MLEATCPVENCKLTVDVVLKSSDGELLGAHQRNLEIYTEGFPISGSTVVLSEPVFLEETAEVLHLMLEYTHNIRLPNLDTTPFTLLASLAEAVEKYLIYSAMENCRIHMKIAIDNHPNEVFFYSTKHNYPDLANRAATLTLKNSAWDFVDRIREAGLHNDVIIRWLRYRDRWMEIVIQLPRKSRVHPTYKGSTCSAWSSFADEVYGEVKRDPSGLQDFSIIVRKHCNTLAGCESCVSLSHIWGSKVLAKIAKLPKYSEIP